jgi:hypothetical protein
MRKRTTGRLKHPKAKSFFTVKEKDNLLDHRLGKKNL